MKSEQLKNALSDKGYAYFDKGLFNLNIIGVRQSESLSSNLFDDILYVSYNKSEGMSVIESFPITTDPGRYWLEKPLNPIGTAILVPGQYRSCYKIALHQGKYEALCQRGPVKVYRDNNKDNILDFDANSIQEGLYGINIHRSNPTSESYIVEKWSAGCQVFKNIDDFNTFMGILRKSASVFGNSFTYTLIESNDLL